MKFLSRFRLLLVACICLFQFSGQTQTKVEDFLEAAKEFEDETEALEQPDAVGADLGPGALRFFFLSAQPRAKTYYFREGEDYRPIQAAYNTFGNVHRISARTTFELCEKRTQIVEGDERVVYVPLFQLDVLQRRNLFAIFLPSATPIEGEVMNLNAIDFSEEMFPYNQMTFMNILPKPVLVSLEGKTSILRPGEILRASYSIRRKGVGYLKLALAVRAADGSAKLLYNQRLTVYEDERTIAIPISDPWGSSGIEVLTYRDSGMNPSRLRERASVKSVPR